jgi:mannitol-1-phosphate 5-dehydrogenase
VNPTEKSIVIFGAGKIGRSFVGQLFSHSGYKIVFVDIDFRVINELNRQKRYKVVIKSENDEVIEVSNVCGILATDTEVVEQAIARCSLMATCVGKNALPMILPTVAKGIERRFNLRPKFPLDIILAENIRDACKLMEEGLTDLLPEGFPINTYLGFIETSIGKMVPIMKKETEESDPLLVYAESYNILILDKNGFKNPIPKVEGLAPKENIKAWVDLKAFVHNLGHVAAAYYGHFKYPERKYLFEVLEDAEVYSFVRAVMLQSASALIVEYPVAFKGFDFSEYIEDLIHRFMNKQLKDTVFRIGCDLKRKLASDDRIVGAIKLAMKHRLEYNFLFEVLIYGFIFHGKDESDQLFFEDNDFIQTAQSDLDKILITVCGFDKKTDRGLIRKIKESHLIIQNQIKQTVF